MVTNLNFFDSFNRESNTLLQSIRVSLSIAENAVQTFESLYIAERVLSTKIS